MQLGNYSCFSCYVEFKGKTSCREYRLEIKVSDNAAFFHSQRNVESRLNTAICKCHATYVGVMLECCRGGSPCLHSILDGILFVAVSQLPSPTVSVRS